MRSRAPHLLQNSFAKALAGRVCRAGAHRSFLGTGVVAAALVVGRVRAVAGSARRPLLVQFADQLGEGFLNVFAGVVLIVAGDVTRLLGAFLFLLESADDGGLDDFAAGRVDGVGDVGMEFGPAIGVAGGPILVEPAAALVAEAGAQGGLAAALRAAGGSLAAGAGTQRSLGSFAVL